MSSIVNLIEHQVVVNTTDSGTINIHEEGIVNIVGLDNVVDFLEPQVIINLEGDLVPVTPSNITMTAGTNLSALRAVTTDINGNAVYASNATPSDSIVIGITATSANAGSLVTILDAGFITDGFWNWVKGPVFLGTNGMLTQTPPTGGATVVHLGRAVSTNTLLIDIDISITTI